MPAARRGKLGLHSNGPNGTMIPIRVRFDGLNDGRCSTLPNSSNPAGESGGFRRVNFPIIREIGLFHVVILTTISGR